jgi:hypothetical protein
LPGLIDDDKEEEEGSQSIDDRVEAEWEKEWAEISVSLHFIYFATY